MPNRRGLVFKKDIGNYIEWKIDIPLAADSLFFMTPVPAVVIQEYKIF